MSDIDERNMVVSFILNRADPADLRYVINACETRQSRGGAGKGMDMQKIAGKKELLRVVKYILSGRSDEDLVLVRSALERRMEGKGRSGPQGPKGLVLGLGMDANSAMRSIHRGARKLAAEIILQHQPEIPESHLNALLDAWVPMPGKRRKGPPIRGEVMLAMIEQFVAYGTGSLTGDELKKFPEGWADKYWEAFPDDVKKLIASYLRGEADKALFWAKIRESLARG